MPETTIWTGTSSQWKNFSANILLFAVVVLTGWLHWGLGWTVWLFLAIVPFAVWAFYGWLRVKTTVYSLTNERLITAHGILTKVTDTLELYRVRDMRSVQPLVQRIVGLQTVHVITADATTPEVALDFIPASANLPELLRKAVEECRNLKRVRSLEMVDEHMPPPDVSDHA